MPRSVREVYYLLLRSPGPMLALSLLTVGSALQFYWGTAKLAFYLTVALVVTRSFIEWSLHRYLWHARPRRRRGLGDNPVAAAHRWHHAHPDAPHGVVFSWSGVLVLYLGVFSGAVLALTVPLAVALANAFMLLLLIYEWFHVLSHSSAQPRALWLRHIIANHRAHHQVAPHKCFGVSSTFADRILGTSLDAHKK